MFNTSRNSCSRAISAVAIFVITLVFMSPLFKYEIMSDVHLSYLSVLISAIITYCFWRKLDL